MKKIIAAVVALLLLTGAGIWWYKSYKAKNHVEPPPTAIVERGSILEEVTSDGKVVSNLDVDIKCKASGEIVKLPYDVSDIVKKGALLVVLDPVDEERNVKQAEASLQSAQAKLQSLQESLSQMEKNLATDRMRANVALDTAKVRYDDLTAKMKRLKELLDQKLAAREEYETAATSATSAEGDLKTARLKMDDLTAQERAIEAARQNVKAAQAQVEIEKVNVDLARQKYADTSVYSPMDCVVTARNVQVGQIISSPYTNVAGGTTVLTLSDLSHIYVLATVDESDISRVVLGQDAKVTVDAYPGKFFKGKVVRIAPRGVNVSNVVTFEVKIEILSENKNLLRPEMTANVHIEVAKKENTLAVPNDAIQRKGQGKYVVEVLKPDNSQDEKEVKIGIGDGRRTEIVSGLGEGETVVLKKSGGDSKWQGQAQGQNRPPMMRIH